MIRELVVVAMLGTVLASCSAKPPCSASSCPFGCCDAMGTCQTPNNSACGTSGATCQACPFLQTCQVGACVPASTIGGGGGGTTGGGGGMTGGGGTTGGGVTGGGTTGGGAGLVVPQGNFRAFRLTFQTGTLAGSCFRSGSGSTTFSPPPLEVLTWDVGSDRFLAPAPGQTYVLGDAPLIRLPDAIITASNETTFATLRNTTQSVGMLDYFESRQTAATFTFGTLAGSTTGTLRLRGEFACANGQLVCPQPSPSIDSATCEVTLQFSATTIAVAPSWFTPSTVVPNSTRLLTAWDESPINGLAVPSCFRNNNLPSGPRVAEQNARALHVLQYTATVPASGNCSSTNCTGCCTRDGQCLSGGSAMACGASGGLCAVCANGGTCSVGACSGQGRQLGLSNLFVDGLTVKLGDSPTISPDALIGAEGDWVYLFNVQTPVNGYTEARQTQAAVRLDSSGTGTAAFNAQYACIRGTNDCPVGNLSPADAASCSTQINVWAVTAP